MLILNSVLRFTFWFRIDNPTVSRVNFKAQPLKLRLSLTLFLTVTDTRGAVLTLMLGYTTENLRKLRLALTLTLTLTDTEGAVLALRTIEQLPLCRLVNTYSYDLRMQRLLIP